MQQLPKKDLVFKILLLGDATVGKTCFLMRYSDDVFMETYLNTIGSDYKLKIVKLDNGKTIKVQLWDTAGQDKYRSIAKNYFKGSHGILLLYDITSQTSFDNIRGWITDIKEEADENVIIFLLGNKIDLTEERKITKEKGEQLAKEFNVPFFEVSAKSGKNVNEVFKTLYGKINESYDEFDRQRSTKIIKKQKNNKKCCS